MRTRNIIIGLGTLLLLILLGWLFLGRTSEPGGDKLPLSGSPFGLGEGTNIPALQPEFEGEVEPLPESSSEGEAVALLKLSGTPVAGFIPLTRGSSTLVRYVDRGTGHIFDALISPENGEVVKSRVTNNTLPQIYEAYFRPDGNAVLLRTLDEADVVKNMSLALTAPRGTSTDGLYGVSMTLLRGNLDSITVNGNSLLYVDKGTGAIATSGFNGEGARTLWNSNFKPWRTGRFGSSTLLFTKPSLEVPGYAYSLSSQGNTTKLAGPLQGLAALASPNSNSLLYSYTDNGIVRLFVRRAGISTEIVPGSFTEKCVWSTKQNTIFFCGAPTSGFTNKEPDNWYKGISHFSDYVWRFDATTQTGTLVLEPETQFGVTLDVTQPTLSPDEKYFVFINKTDQSLWAIRLF